MPTAFINGHEIKVDHSGSILKYARSLSINIPTLCDDPRLKACGACRMCLVKIAGASHPIASCMTELKAGMVVETHTPELENARKMHLQMLARNYPAAMFEQYPDKPFHNLAIKYGLRPSDFAPEPLEHRPDHSHTYIDVEMSRCIDCYRCVRICDEVQGQFVWQIADRGESTRIIPDTGGAFGESTCVSCGACVDSCPTGALEDKTVLDRGFPTAWTKTVCPYCGTGCEMDVGTRDGKIVQIRPAMESPVNHGHLCVKGRYAFDFVDAADRMTEPMIREGSTWRQVTWDEAIAFAATRLQEILQRYGPNRVGVLGSARATNEENYLAQKFARTVIGTNNVDCCARVCHTPSAAAMKMMLGTGAATNSFVDIELTKTILICGANATENHPIVGERIKQAVLRKGTNLIVIDPRQIELARYADIHLQLRPGTNVPLLNSIAHVIITEGLCDRDYIGERVAEFDEFEAFLSEFQPEKVADICGVSADLIRRTARLYSTEGPAMCFHGLGLTEHVQGTEGVMCLINLALLTGNLGKRGAGINPLRGQNNVQGSAQMGCDPGILTGSIAVGEGRDAFEKIWQESIPTQPGLNLLHMLDAAREGQFKALWAIGYDLYLTNANAAATEEALRSLDLVIVQDMFLNETAREFAHVFFPAASSFEKDGTFMNSERRIQRVRKALEPRGNSLSDWEIISLLAAAMGKGSGFSFRSPEQIWDEIREVWPAAGGVSYARLEREGLQWPCGDESDPGTEILHTESFGNDKRARLRRIKYRPTPEVVSGEFPILLTTGRSLYHFNAGTMTTRTPNVELRPSDLLLLNPIDARNLSLEDGQLVVVESRWGEAKLPVQFTDSVSRGEAFATFHSAEIFLNRATSPHRDRHVQAPEYKVTAVRIKPA